MTYSIFNVSTKELSSFAPGGIESPAAISIDPVENILFIASYRMKDYEGVKYVDYTANGYVNYYDLETMTMASSFDCGIGPQRIGFNVGVDYIIY